jgi:glycerol-3-phosphate acyltransferase PlsY
LRNVAVASGLCVVFAYVLGSIPFGFLLHRQRLRRDLRRLDRPAGDLDLQLRALLAGATSAPSGLLTDFLAAALDTAKVLLAATVAWHVVHRIPPHHVDRTNFSAVAFVANQVLLGWQSVALWAGLAAAVSHLAPVWLRFRGGQGQAPVLALVVVYFPYGFLAGAAAFLLALAFTRDAPRAVLISLPAFVAYAWLAWIFDWRPGWGVPNGPELALWAAVLAGVVGARTVGAAPPAPG